MRAALRRVLTEAGNRPGVIEAVLRLAGVGLLVGFAAFYGTRWALMAAGAGLFVVTSERSL